MSTSVSVAASVGPEYLTTGEAAVKIRTSPDYVRRQCENGNLRAKKLGNTWRIKPADLDAFMSGSPAPATRPTRRRAS